MIRTDIVIGGLIPTHDWIKREGRRKGLVRSAGLGSYPDQQPRAVA